MPNALILIQAVTLALTITITLAPVTAQNPIITVAVTPATVINVNEAINFAATAQTFTKTANNQCAVAFRYTLIQSPIPVTGFPPVISTSAQPTTDVNGMNVPGLYVFQLTATDCGGQTTTLNINVRALGGTYDTATATVAIDTTGTFALNGATSAVNGFKSGQTLTVSLPGVAPGNVFSLVGRNAPTTTAPNPAMVAATITWRDMDFHTNTATWNCGAGDLTAINGNNNWMKPGFNTALPPAVSQGTNIAGSVWAALNGNAVLAVGAAAQFLWTQSTLNFPATDASIVSCRSVFTPPAEIVTGLQIVTSTTTPAPTNAATNPPTSPATTVPVTTAPVPTTPAVTTPTVPPPPVPTTAPTSGSSSTGMAAPVDGAGQQANGGAGAVAGTGGGNKVNPLFIAIPIVIVAAIVALVFIIRQRRKALTPTPISKLSEMV